MTQGANLPMLEGIQMSHIQVPPQPWKPGHSILSHYHVKIESSKETRFCNKTEQGKSKRQRKQLKDKDLHQSIT